ncbi:MAG: type II secretion system major pseudopilin GspG [Nitrospiraceae bacterium]|nr:MAG: type II secretion system major pseudopilin GspG [Nitrospiraceae bacterium]
MRNSKRNVSAACQRGFTLIELMVVMIILGLLAALVVPKMFGKLETAKTNAAYAQIELFGTALDSYRLDVGKYPSSSEGLESLISPVSGAEEWNGPYLRKNEIPLDPWGNPYIYESPGTHGDYDLYSLGADNSEGGEGEDRDVVSWKGLK